MGEDEKSAWLQRLRQIAQRTAEPLGAQLVASYSNQ